MSEEDDFLNEPDSAAPPAVPAGSDDASAAPDAPVPAEESVGEETPVPVVGAEEVPAVGENEGEALVVLETTAPETAPVDNEGDALIALDSVAPSSVPPDGEGYQIRLRNFEGPLDLLLFLIRKKKVEINDIPIAVITREYLAYLAGLESIDIDREAEFLLMAAVLIYIKSQTLLPREQVLEPDVGQKIRNTDHLMPFDKIKAVATLLRDKEEEQSSIWQRSALTAPLPDQDLDLVEVSLFDLAESFFALMKRKQAETAKVFKGKEINMADKMNEIVESLRTRGALDFLDYLWAQETLEEALIAFFCLLELIKARIVMAVQEQLFNTIKVWLRKDAPAKDEA